MTAAVTEALWPHFEKRIKDATDRLLQAQVEPWLLLAAGEAVTVKAFDGQPLDLQGPAFTPAMRHAFWDRYIDPWLQEMVLREIDDTVALAQQRRLDARLLLPDVQGLLIRASQRVYWRMSDIDQRLQDDGLRSGSLRRAVDDELAAMRRFIEQRVAAEVAAWQPSARPVVGAQLVQLWPWLALAAVAAALVASLLL